MEKQSTKAGRFLVFFVGVHAQEIPGGPLKSDHNLCMSASFLMTLSRVGFLTLASQQISISIDWFDLPAVQGTLKSLLQHHNSKASILWLSAFFIVQFSHPYMIPGKTITLTRRTFVSKVISLIFNMLSRLVILKEIIPDMQAIRHD